MRIAGMTVVERLSKEHLQAGDTVWIRCTTEEFQSLHLEGVQHLAHGKSLPKSTEISANQLLGIDLVDEASRSKAEWAVMQTCRRPYDGLADRYWLRAISLRISRACTKAPITPNHITAISTLCGLTTCLLLALCGKEAWALRVAGLTIFSAVILDSVDGELARVRHMGSKLGMWLDNLSDDVIDTSIVACMGIAVGGPWLPLALIATAMRGFAALVTYHGAAKLGHPGDVMAFRWWFESDQETEEVYETPFTPLMLLRSFGRRDMYITVFAISFAAGYPLAALLLAMGNAVGHFVLAVLHLFLSTQSQGNSQ